MSVTLDADPSSPTFNCFCSTCDAEDFFMKRLWDDAWRDAEEAEKEMALLWATRLLDTLKWKGYRTSNTQNLSWPRAGVVYNDSDTYTVTGILIYPDITIDSTTVPQQIKDSTAELALWMLQSDVTAPTGNEGYKRIKVDVIELEPAPGDRPPWFSESVYRLCSMLLSVSGAYNANVVRT